MVNVQNSENGRKWSMVDVSAELNGHVAAMAQGSFNLVATGALMFTVGVYVDGLDAKAVSGELTKAMLQLNYGKSSRYALTSAALDVGRDLVKRFGRPDAAKERNVFWQMVAEAATVAEAVALFVSAIKTTYSVATMSDLNAVLNPPKADKPKADKPRADKVAAAMEGAGPREAAAIAGQVIASHVAPADTVDMLRHVAEALNVDQLQAVMLMIGDVLAAKQAAADAEAAAAMQQAA